MSELPPSGDVIKVSQDTSAAESLLRRPRGDMDADDDATTETSRRRAREVLRRRAIVVNKNIQQWHSWLEMLLPKVLSVCMRTSGLNVALLEASVVRELILSKIHGIMER